MSDPREIDIHLKLNLKDVEGAYGFVPEGDSRTILGPAVIYIDDGRVIRAVVISDGRLRLTR